MDAKKILYNIVYIPIMKRWGDDEHGHNYLMGAYDNLDKAKEIAEQEREDRGGKYEWVIEAHSLNAGRFNKLNDKIYRVARSEEMNCLIDIEREEVLNDSEKFALFYKSKTLAMLKSDLENAQKFVRMHNERAIDIQEQIEKYERK